MRLKLDDSYFLVTVVSWLSAEDVTTQPLTLYFTYPVQSKSPKLNIGKVISSIQSRYDPNWNYAVVWTQEVEKDAWDEYNTTTDSYRWVVEV